MAFAEARPFCACAILPDRCGPLPAQASGPVTGESSLFETVSKALDVCTLPGLLTATAPVSTWCAEYVHNQSIFCLCFMFMLYICPHCCPLALTAPSSVNIGITENTSIKSTHTHKCTPLLPNRWRRACRKTVAGPRTTSAEFEADMPEPETGEAEAEAAEKRVKRGSHSSTPAVFPRNRRLLPCRPPPITRPPSSPTGSASHTPTPGRARRTTPSRTRRSLRCTAAGATRVSVFDDQSAANPLDATFG